MEEFDNIIIEATIYRAIQIINGVSELYKTGLTKKPTYDSMFNTFIRRTQRFALDHDRKIEIFNMVYYTTL